MIGSVVPPQFRGRFEVKVDPKFRLILPASFREVLRTITDSRMIITNSQYQGKRCLDAYPFSEWTKLEKKISKLPQLKVEVQNFQRFYLSGGHPVDIDAQSRLLIPPTLRSYAGIQSEVVLVGFANKFEIWSQETWSGLFDNLAQDFSQTLAAVSEIDTHDE
ncbi:MAG: division/cell wall cluster transcriptional repressor MraZ [Oligoflexia bacterium]|nr:division/cell wall cluster transcriptional repressor MraZ [Oligoflexia bacterium]